jgi:hypothetical protein
MDDVSGEHVGEFALEVHNRKVLIAVLDLLSEFVNRLNDLVLQNFNHLHKSFLVEGVSACLSLLLPTGIVMGENERVSNQVSEHQLGEAVLVTLIVLGHVEILHDNGIRDDQLGHGKLVEENHGVLDGIKVSVLTHLAHESIGKPHAWVDKWLVFGVSGGLTVGHEVPDVAKDETTGPRVGHNSLLLIEPYSGQGPTMQVEEEQGEEEYGCDGDFQTQQDKI